MFPQDHSEMIANLKLCYRHLEDARMRLGKAIQAHDGGCRRYGLWRCDRTRKETSSG
jgi:hypothetical protein